MAVHGFEVGEVVVLKSGGPRMTVAGEDGFNEDMVACTWFDEKNKVVRDSFPPQSLKRYDPEEFARGAVML